MDKRMGIEGNGASKIVQLMRQHGYNKGAGIEVGEVISPLPGLRIKVGVDSVDLDMDDLIVSQTAANCNLRSGDRVILIGSEDEQHYFVMDRAVTD